MRRLTTIALGVALLLSAPAQARLTEVGRLEDGVRGSCPERPCLAMSRTTGYQAKVGPRRGLYEVPRDGRIVAWSLALGNPGPEQIAFFDERLGGPASAALVVLRPGRRLRQTVVAKAPLQRLQEHFGRTVQFPLERTIEVRRGQLLALTVPTWAPALQVNLGGDTSWRASRPRDRCSDNQTQTGLLGRTRMAQFFCLYRTARLAYSATLISTP